MGLMQEQREKEINNVILNKYYDLVMHAFNILLKMKNWLAT